MQTFLPYRHFSNCASVLDNKRLNKQILETYQIYQAAFGTSKGWRNHPCVKMWRDLNPHCLVNYGLRMCEEYSRRSGKIHAYHEKLKRLADFRHANYCYHIPDLTRSYRSLLLRKDPAHYRRFWPKLSASIPFVWPDGTVSKS